MNLPQLASTTKPQPFRQYALVWQGANYKNPDAYFGKGEVQDLATRVAISIAGETHIYHLDWAKPTFILTPDFLFVGLEHTSFYIPMQGGAQ